MKKNIKQKFINIQAFKYDGKLYRQWNGAKVIDEDKEFCYCLLYKTKVTEDNGQKWVIKEPTLWFFSKKNFYNVLITCREDGLYYYINLASPFYVEDSTIKYIDFDLDIKIYPDKPFQIIDQNDFQKNMEKIYNQEIVNAIYKNVLVTSKRFHNRDSIFDPFYIKNLYRSLIIMKEIDQSFEVNV